MPEFHLDKGTPESAAAFGALDAFTQGYLEAAFFTESNDLYDSDEWDSEQAQSDIREGRCGGDIPGDSSIADMSPEAMARAIADCAEFQSAAAELLEQAYSETDYESEQAGRDFWYTRNGHGVGFWDREALDWFALDQRKLGDALTSMCGYGTAFPPVDFYRGDDGRLYFA